MLHTGEVIRNRRQELGLTQNELARGICSPNTLSRLENGSHEPSRGVFEAVMERLGLPTNRYHTFINPKELEAYDLTYSITSSLSLFDYEETERLAGRLEEIITPNDKVYWQALLRVKALLAGRKHGPAIGLEGLLEALAVTNPPFEQADVSRLLLSMTEVRILYNMTDCYHKLGDIPKALSIATKVIACLVLRFIDPTEAVTLLTGFYMKSSKYKGLLGNHSAALQDAETGIALCKRHGKLTMLPHLLLNAGYVRYQMNNEDPKAVKQLQQCYTVFEIVNDETNMSIVKAFCVENNILLKD